MTKEQLFGTEHDTLCEFIDRITEEENMPNNNEVLYYLMGVVDIVANIINSTTLP